MMNRPLCAAVLVLVAGLSILEIRGFGRFGIATQSLAADEKHSKDNEADIAKQEMALASEALPVVTQLEKQGRSDPGSHAVSIWSRRLLEATRKSGATKAEVMQAIKDHLARMDERVEALKARQQSDRGTELEVLNARYDALEAKAWLAAAQKE